MLTNVSIGRHFPLPRPETRTGARGPENLQYKLDYIGVRFLTQAITQNYIGRRYTRSAVVFAGPGRTGTAPASYKETILLKKALGCAVIICLTTGLLLLNNAQGADLAKGKALYEERCVLCHGPKGDGKGQGAIALNPKPADYTKK